MKILLPLTILLFVVGCTSVPMVERDPSSKMICKWGQQEFDLCQYADRDERIEALIEEMNLDEKIGQMTQSVWHNGVSPEIIRMKNIGSIIHTEGPTPGPAAADWIRTFNEF